MYDRRSFLRTVAAGAAGLLVTAPNRGFAGQTAKSMAIYKTPTCGCCAKWVDHVRAAGFEATIHDMEDVSPIKQKHGVPEALASCHTAIVDGYVVEGHVPADLITRMITEKPKITGIAVPGMPAGSPGMDMGPRKVAYDVIAFDRSGKTSVFASR